MAEMVIDTKRFDELQSYEMWCKWWERRYQALEENHAKLDKELLELKDKIEHEYEVSDHFLQRSQRALDREANLASRLTDLQAEYAELARANEINFRLAEHRYDTLMDERRYGPSIGAPGTENIEEAICGIPQYARSVLYPKRPDKPLEPDYECPEWDLEEGREVKVDPDAPSHHPSKNVDVSTKARTTFPFTNTYPAHGPANLDGLPPYKGSSIAMPRGGGDPEALRIAKENATIAWNNAKERVYPIMQRLRHAAKRTKIQRQLKRHLIIHGKPREELWQGLYDPFAPFEDVTVPEPQHEDSREWGTWRMPRD